MEINAELKKKTLDEKPESLTQGVTSVINGIVRKYYGRYGESRVAREIIAGIWNGNICGGAATKCAMIKVVKKYYQEYIFTPENILRAMDLAGGTCNLKALTILRDVEVCANDPFKDTSRKKCDAILPHEWRVRRAAKLVHRFADDIIPLKHYKGKHGEVVEFKDIGGTVKMIYDAFGLGEVAKNGSVDVCVTMDGTNLTKFLNFVIAGLKMVDPRAVNPLTGEKELCPLFSKALPQSRKWCFPMKFVMGQESADMYEEHFNEMFEMFYKASLEGQDIFSGWKPVTYSNPCDMAAQQKSLGLGGAAKVKNRFCHACALHSKNIAKPNDVMCVDCLSFFEKDGNWKCYCQPFASSEQTEKYRKALDDLVVQHQVNIEDIKKMDV